MSQIFNQTVFCFFCKQKLIEQADISLTAHKDCYNQTKNYNNLILTNDFITHYLQNLALDKAKLNKIKTTCQVFTGFTRKYSKNKFLDSIRDLPIPKKISLSSLKKDFAKTCLDYPQINSFYSCKSQLKKSVLLADIKKSLTQTKSDSCKCYFTSFNSLEGRLWYYVQIYKKLESMQDFSKNYISFYHLIKKNLYALSKDGRTAQFKSLSYPEKFDYYVVFGGRVDHVNAARKTGYSYDFIWHWALCFNKELTNMEFHFIRD